MNPNDVIDIVSALMLLVGLFLLWIAERFAGIARRLDPAYWGESRRIIADANPRPVTHHTWGVPPMRADELGFSQAEVEAGFRDRYDDNERFLRELESEVKRHEWDALHQPTQGAPCEILADEVVAEIESDDSRGPVRIIFHDFNVGGPIRPDPAIEQIKAYQRGRGVLRAR